MLYCVCCTNLVIRTWVHQHCWTIRNWWFWKSRRCHCSTSKCTRCKSFRVQHCLTLKWAVFASTKIVHYNWNEYTRMTQWTIIALVWCVSGTEVFRFFFYYLQIVFVEVCGHQFGIYLWRNSIWCLKCVFKVMNVVLLMFA